MHLWLRAQVASAKFGIHVGSTGAHTFTWNTTGLTSAEQWDLDTNGIRLFHFKNSSLTVIGQIIDTAMMFSPMLSKACCFVVMLLHPSPSNVALV